MSTSSYNQLGKTRAPKGVLTACKILANRARYKILSTLLRARNAKKELCVNEIAEAIGVSQSATSHQLALLEAYGVVEGMKMGQTTCYDISDTPLARDIEKIINIFSRKL